MTEKENKIKQESEISKKASEHNIDKIDMHPSEK